MPSFHIEIAPYAKAIAEHKNTINQHKQEVAAKELEEDKATDLLMSGVLDKEIYARTIKKIRDEKRHFVDLLEQSQMSITDKFYETSEKILELCISAKTLWEKANAQERLQFLEKVLSNQYLDGSTIRYDLKKPFAVLAEMKKTEEKEFGALGRNQKCRTMQMSISNLPSSYAEFLGSCFACFNV